MKRESVRRIAAGSFALAAGLGGAWSLQAQNAQGHYPRMAPLDHYLMQRDAEIAMARSAAPEAISQYAGEMVLGRHGYETVVKGRNAFVCLVQRSWTAPSGDPDVEARVLERP